MVALGASLAAGGALLAAFPPFSLWWLAPVGVALLAAAAHRRRPRAGAALGLLTGLAFFTPLLSWTNLHTGNLPWLLLSGLQAAYLALLGLLTALVSPLVDRSRWVWPPVTAVLWVAQEALRDRTPFGGFPWGRLAFSQDDSPLLRVAALGGAPLVTFVVALAGGFLVAGLWRRWIPLTGVPWRWAVGGPVAAAAVVLGALLVPVGAVGGAGAGTATVAIVQGNVPRLGLDFNEQRRAVLDNHVNATVELAERVAAGAAPRPDLVVWPENSSDIDPLRHPDAAARISTAADAIGAPILVGAVLLGPGPGQVRNVGLVWEPETGPDRSQLYIKRHPVPFAEYVPMREIARMVSKEVDRVRSDFVAGTDPGVLRTGGVVLGDVICFEVAYDSIVRDTVTGGSQVLVVQTNNATFNEAEARQQLAMVRLRAVEHGRAALMASTVGVSGFVGADGRVSDATGFNTAAVVVRQMNLVDGHTLATRVGVWPEVVLVVAAGCVVVAAMAMRRRRDLTTDTGTAAGQQM
ncbi:MAG TPA: apolipoprotein N-acyltransferase [Micromonosporaceae bacterium]|nr:apolipoprotein N-acyltransferase [Micromonosporaceae bacterium]